MVNKTIFIQNIVSPYRNRFFNVLNKFWGDFKVFYMAETESDRNWDVSRLKHEYDHWIDHKGRNIKLGWYQSHFNPRLVWRALRDKESKNIVLAVSWTDLNIFAIALAKRLHLTKKRLFFWAEANYTAEWTKKHDTKLKWWIKRFVFKSVDGAFIIPGQMSKITFEKWKISAPDYIHLPNTIDDESLVYDKSLRVYDQLPTFLMPIRIIEEVKGGLNFFTSIGPENVRKARFIIAGDGKDKDLYREYIKSHNYGDNIILEGFCDSKRMTELYNKVNALVLPSYSDPSPLSIVEALFFHLPILCSKHCGNHFEAVIEGVNGYTFSPLDSNDIKSKYERFIDEYPSWIERGKISGRIYREKFESQLVIRNFISSYIAKMK